jgi:hypothetical protein
MLNALRSIPAFKPLLVAALGLTTSLGLAVACGPLDNASDCTSVCETYASCYDDSYDVEGCRDRCIDQSAGDDEYTAQVNSCDACIQGQDCVENVFECGGECADIIDE